MPVNIKETRVGQVVSDRMQKTVVVAVKVSRRHAVYGKALRRTRKYKAHDELNQSRVGDTVRIAPGRPISREKRWWVMEILSRKGEAAAVRPVEEAEVVAAIEAPVEEAVVAEVAEAPAAEEAPVEEAVAAEVAEAPAAEEAPVEEAPADEAAAATEETTDAEESPADKEAA